ncbi:MAG: methylmalonyl-CoA mutase family protein [Pseudomonadota bacterium]|nr:methylmalonyl-CoA mutase family protein [Pseudomonadota bacterium]
MERFVVTIEGQRQCDPAFARLRRAYGAELAALSTHSLGLLRDWPRTRESWRKGCFRNPIRGRSLSQETCARSPCGTPIPRLALPDTGDAGELLGFLLDENLPGHFPFTAGVYPFRREGEEPTRMFAGEGSPERTNRRFHYLIGDLSYRRLSTAFDPVTLYGEDPAPEPDRLACVGMSGVSVATVDDMKRLYSGVDLCDPSTSVSMTINGPAPAMLAMFLDAATDQQVEKHLHAIGGWRETRRIVRQRWPEGAPRYEGELPAGHDGLGLGLLGVSGEDVVGRETYEAIRADTLHAVRGTLQADILKEDQAQNECIFSLPFALRLMGDIQQYLIDNRAEHYYGVSVSGYHIAEAGAGPVTQLAFTLANGFTLLEICLARGMPIDEIAPRFSFFFSNALDPEFAVIGRVARRVWARAMREVYGASPRAQRLKYHAQTSGRSLQSEDIDFNDIRTTLEALYATLDNCNSLHTNAFDEAVTTPTEESVRRALAIQMILNRESGLRYGENVLQGSYWIREMTGTVEEAVYDEFDRLSRRGGVLGAMESGYQRSRIQAEGAAYERGRSDGTIPVVGVNTFRAAEPSASRSAPRLVRTTPAEQRRRVRTVEAFRDHHRRASGRALARLEDCARAGRNVFGVLPGVVRCCTLGQITDALYRAGGRYRRRI